MIKDNNISTTQAAELLGLTTRQMRRLAATIPGAFKIGKTYVIPLFALLKLKARRDKAQKKRAQDSSES